MSIFVAASAPIPVTPFHLDLYRKDICSLSSCESIDTFSVSFDMAVKKGRKKYEDQDRNGA
jgi:hypothetical protein